MYWRKSAVPGTAIPSGSRPKGSRRSTLRISRTRNTSCRCLCGWLNRHSAASPQGDCVCRLDHELRIRQKSWLDYLICCCPRPMSLILKTGERWYSRLVFNFYKREMLTVKFGKIDTWSDRAVSRHRRSSLAKLVRVTAPRLAGTRSPPKNIRAKDCRRQKSLAACLPSLHSVSASQDIGRSLRQLNSDKTARPGSRLDFMDCLANYEP